MTIGLSHVTLNLLIASVTMLVLVGTTKRFRTKLCHSYYFATVVVVVLKKKTIEVLAIYSEGHAAFPRKLQEKKKKNARNANMHANSSSCILLPHLFHTPKASCSHYTLPGRAVTIGYSFGDSVLPHRRLRREKK